MGGLAAMGAEMRKVSQSMGEGLAGIRTQIAELQNGLTQSLSQAFDKLGKTANAASTKASSEVQQATQRTEEAARSAVTKFKASMMVGAQNYEQARLGAMVREADADKKYVYRMMVGSAQYEQARLAQTAKEADADTKYTYRMMVGSAKIAEQVEQASLKEENAKLGYRIKMMAGSYKLSEEIEKAAEKEEAAKLGYRIKMMAGSYKLVEDADKAAAQEAAAKLAFTAKMQVGSLKIAEAQASAAEKEDAAKLGYRIKLMNGSYKLSQAMEESAAREASAQLAWIAKMQVGSLKIAEQMEKDALRIAAAAERKDAAIRRSVRQATTSSNAPWTSLVSGSVYNVGEESSQATPKLKAFTDQLNYAHSAARGLASGFGAMWLTWGQVIPLLAGAAISHSFVQVVKSGAEVQNTFAQIRVLAGATAEDVAILNGQMSSLAKSSQFGPKELAEAMKTLSLAGLNTAEVYSSVKDVLNFATAGDTSIKQAADVMTTVATAFNISADSYGMVGDKIAKAAAESKSSVESMGEAFKTASVINQQYGVSLDDTAIGLALLANAGIQGTAAGTALRNMYADLAGRTPKVSAALKQLGIDTLDSTGKMRAQSEIFKEMVQNLSRFDGKSQFKIIQDVFSERGGKEAIAIMNALGAKAKEMGTTAANAYDELAEKVANAAGFTAQAAAQMSLTPLNQMKSVAATLQNTLVAAFEDMQPAVLDFATRLKSIFNSEEFKSTLQTLLGMVASLTGFLVENGKVILTVVAAYVSFRSIVGILAAVSAATAAWGEVTVAATTAVGMATRAAIIANPMLTALTAVVTAAAAGWAIYTLWANKAAEKQGDLATNSAAELLKKLEDEEDRLKKVNEARSRGITLMQLEAEVSLAKARTEVSPELAKARKALADFDSGSDSTAYLGGLPPDARIPGSRGFAAQADPNKRLSERTKLLAAVTAAETAYGDVLLRSERALAGINAAAKEGEEAETARLARVTKEFGSQVYAGKGAAGSKGRHNLYYENGASKIESEMQQAEATLKASYDNQRQMLESKHKNELISDGTYFAQLSKLQQDYDKQQDDNLNTAVVRRQEFFGSRLLEADSLKGEDRQRAIENATNDWEKFLAVVQRARLTSDSIMDRQADTARNDTLGKINKLKRDDNSFISQTEASIRKDSEQSISRIALAGATEEVRAQEEARIKVLEKFQPELEKLQREEAKVRQSLEDFSSTALEDGPPTETTVANWQNLQTEAAALRAEIDKLTAARGRLTGVAQEGAVNELQAKRNQDIRNDFKAYGKEAAGALASVFADSGKRSFKGLIDWAQEYLLKRPLKMVIQAILQPVGNMIANVGLNALGLGSVGGQGGGLGTFANFGSMLSGGAGSGGLMNMLGGIGGAGGIDAVGAGMGSLAEQAAITQAMGGSALGATGGSLMAGMGAIGTALPYVGAAIAAYSLLSGKGGGPRASGMAGLGVEQHADNSYGKQLQGVVDTYNKQLSAAMHMLNGTGSASIGLAVSTDPRGTAATHVQNASTVNGQSVHYRWDGSVGRDDASLQAAIDTQAKEAFLYALKATDVKGGIVDWLRAQNIDGAVEDTYARVNKALIEQEDLQSKLDDITLTATQKLTKARAAEKDAIDETNQALLKQLYAQQDLITAGNVLLASYNDQTQTITELRDYAKSLRDWVTQAMTGDDSPLNAFEKLTQASSQFDDTLAKAHGGDKDARAALTGSASTYLTNLKAMASNNVDYAMGFAKVASALTTESASADSQATLMQQQLDTAKGELEALGLLNTTVTTFSQAWADYNAAKDARDQAAAAAALAAAAYTPYVAPAAIAAAAATGNIWNNSLDGYSGGDGDGSGSGAGGAFATGGYHWGGVRLVGENGPEIEATGSSYIHDAAATRRLLSGGDDGSDNADVVEAIDRLDAALRANVGFTYQMAKDIRELKQRGFPVVNDQDGNGRLKVYTTAG